MKVERLITMANQIGDFYEVFPDQEQAQKDIVQHLNKFWAQSMRDDISAHVKNNDGEGLAPIVLNALRNYL